MDEPERRVAALRAELDQLKNTLFITTDEIKRHEIHRRINTCICESVVLIQQRSPIDWATPRFSHPGAQ